MQFNTGLNIAKTLASSFEGARLRHQSSRQLFDAQMKHVLDQNQDLLGIWSVWEPNSLDGNDKHYINTPETDETGRYISYWNRFTGKIVVEPSVDYDKPVVGDYYQVPKITRSEYITRPTIYVVSGKSTTMVDFVAPVVVKERFVGAVGVDYSLEYLKRIISAIRPLGTGYADLIYFNGNHVTHLSDRNIDKSPIPQDIRDALQLGGSVTRTGYSSFLKSRVVEVYSPIRLGKTAISWTVVVVMPERAVLQSSNDLQRLIALISILTFVFTIGLIAYITRGVVRPIENMKLAAARIAEGDLTQNIDYHSDDEIGVLAAAFNHMTDQLKSSLESLRYNEEHFRTLIENASDVITTMDADGTIRYESPSVWRVLGYQPDEPIGKNAFELIHPDDVTRVRSAVDELIEHGVDTPLIEFRFLHKDGSWRMLEAIAINRLNDPSVSRIVVNARDITERNRAENALKDSERRLANILNFLPDPTFAIDLQGRVTLWNHAVERLTGIKAEYMIGKTNYEIGLVIYGERRPLIIDLVQSSTSEQEKKYSQFQREDGALLAESHTPLVRPNGAYLWGKASTLFDSEGNVTGFIETLRDVTDRRLAEQEKRAFYRDTILSATDGKLNVSDSSDIAPYMDDAQIVKDVSEPYDGAVVRHEIDTFCSDLGLIKEWRDNFIMAVGEAVGNVLKHAGRGRVYTGANDDIVWVVAYDEGPGIESLLLPSAVLRQGFSTKPSMGLGYSIMLQMSDKILLSTGKDGTVVVLIRNRREETKSLLASIPDTWGGIAD